MKKTKLKEKKFEKVIERKENFPLHETMVLIFFLFLFICYYYLNGISLILFFFTFSLGMVFTLYLQLLIHYFHGRKVYWREIK